MLPVPPCFGSEQPGGEKQPHKALRDGSTGSSPHIPQHKPVPSATAPRWGQRGPPVTPIRTLRGPRAQAAGRISPHPPTHITNSFPMFLADKRGPCICSGFQHGR